MMKKWFLVVFGALVIPVVGVVAATRYAYQTGSPPFDPDWPTIAIAAGLAIGVASIAQLPFRGAARRFAVLVVYAPVWFAILWMISFMTGCFSGDC
ncbi:MAG: hypothetical protein DWQ08_10575 [Proteobacteria bacterium]|nr:MAG: hypothetical protein DWQ08_10575 [Pseudomonadota bacterium]